MQHYPVEEKREAVRLVEEEHQTYAVVVVMLEIRKAERIEVWVRKYRREGELSFHQPIGRPPKAQAEQRELERLRMENDLLKIAGTAARAAQYRAIYHHKEEYEVKAMCEFFGVSRASYYERVKELEKPDPDQEHMDQVGVSRKSKKKG